MSDIGNTKSGIARIAQPIVQIDPVLARLVERLPQPDSAWPMRERARWLRAFAASLELIYDPESKADVTATLMAAASLVSAGPDEVEGQVRSEPQASEPAPSLSPPLDAALKEEP